MYPSDCHWAFEAQKCKAVKLLFSSPAPVVALEQCNQAAQGPWEIWEPCLWEQRSLEKGEALFPDKDTAEWLITMPELWQRGGPRCRWAGFFSEARETEDQWSLPWPTDITPQLCKKKYSEKRGKNLERKGSRKRRSEAVKTEFRDDTASNKVNTKTPLEEKTQTHLWPQCVMHSQNLVPKTEYRHFYSHSFFGSSVIC